MKTFLDRVNSFSPISTSEFSYEFISWITTLIDTLNESLATTQNAFNVLHAPSYNSTEITNLFSQGTLEDGAFLYDLTNNVYVGVENGALVKFTTTSYP